MSIIIEDKVYVPLSILNEQRIRRIKKQYQCHSYIDKTCQSCEYLVDRPTVPCYTCEAYQGFFKFWKIVEKDDDRYLTLPIGDRGKISKLVPEIKGQKIDLRSNKKAKHRISMTQELYDYQELAVEEMTKRGFGVLKSAPRTGKCVLGNSIVQTSSGIFYIKDLFDKWTRDIFTSTKTGKEKISQMYRKKSRTIHIKTEYGYQIEGTPEHPVYVLTRELKYVWKRLDSIKVGDVICINKGSNCWANKEAELNNHYNPAKKSTNIVPCTKYPKFMNLYLAEFLGYCVANGDLFRSGTGRNSFNISSCNRHIHSRIKVCLEELFGYTPKLVTDVDVPYSIINNVHIASLLQNYGLRFVKSNRKEIPFSVLESTKESLIAFLSAYFTCDSYIPKNGTDAIELCSASPKLIKQLHTILTYFGIISKYTTRQSYAYNSKSPTIRTYGIISIYSNYRELFVKTFKLGKKYTKPSNKQNKGDIIPYIGKYFENIYNKYHVKSGVYKSPYFVGRLKLRNYRHNFKDNIFSSTANTIIRDNCLRLSPKFARVFKVMDNSFFHDRIVTIQHQKNVVPVYDMTVPGSHSFVANGIVVHNTVMAAAITCRLGLKTLILAHQIDLLEQFYKTFEEFTDAVDIGKFKGTRIFGICETVEDFSKYDICLATYQKFISSGGKKRLNKIRKLFGLVIVDEVHKANANCFSRVVNRLTSKYRIGMSATPQRKDELHFIVENIVGPIKHTTKAQALTPIVSLVETGLRTSYNYKQWVYANRFIERQEERNKLIVKHVLKDVLVRKRSMLIPAVYQSQVKNLVDEINKAAGKKIACGYHGKLTKKQRTDVLEKARKGKIKCLVAMRSMLTGINVPIWSVLYEIMPIANPPNFEQEILRICTPMENKPQPYIKFFIDDFGLSKGCFCVCFQTFRKLGIKFTKKSKARLGYYLSTAKRSTYNEDDEYKAVRTIKKRL